MPEILIRGMEMPTKDSIIVAIRPDGKIEDVMGCYIGTAVELPPHGDLIDRREMKSTLGQFIGKFTGDNLAAFQLVDFCAALLRGATVVVPAERREE